MPSLPSGTVTFVFTDIEESTALLQKLGDAYAGALSDHRRIVREAFGAHGVEIDTQGDAFFFAFPRAREAVAAAVAVQRAHAAHDWPGDGPVRVRIGLHTGEPSVAEEGYVGLDVVRAARICTSAQGGHVLLSETTRALLGSALPQGVSVFPLGERHLKGIEEPERVYELEIEDLEREEPGPVPEEVELQPPTEPKVEGTPFAPAPAHPEAAHGERETEKRFEDLGERLAAGIQEKVAERLERAFQKLESLPAPTPGEDTDVEDLVARSASLEEKIRARVDAALKARGVSRDDD
jgi:class 3 adenylate cyclase